MSLGNVVDQLGVTLDISKTQRVTELFIVGKVMDLTDGQVYLVLGSNGLDWITECGLLDAAEKARAVSIAAMVRTNAVCPRCGCKDEE